MLDGKLESFTPKVQYVEKLLVGEYLVQIKIASTVQASAGKILARWKNGLLDRKKLCGRIAY
jgi:hypothetical protein